MNTSPPVLNADNGNVSVQDTVTHVVSDGDVVLVVGPGQHKIQVSSHFLKLISLVFRVMLDAPMKEGQDLASRYENDAPVEIILPGDKEAPMEQVLVTLYGADPSSKNHLMREVKEIAILAEKYGTVDRLEIFSGFWLRSTVNMRITEISDNAWNALVSAYILKIDWAFFSVSMAMVKTKTSLLKFAASFHDKHTGMRLGMAIEELRSTYLGQKGITKPVEKGLCLFCFSLATDSFTRQRQGCHSPDRHFNV
ncbi:hypothetical protein FAGAP_2363 [Fusarium agapanthi]|uniref:BTB domain-containing protein n=1 Tax=Fusarium agapanthi TaxID=1803897 RepID=A0A9P5EFY7_9HYPO|nr:hypothetical protein FAGAP_2363 [Fusarium agapanthi]